MSRESRRQTAKQVDDAINRAKTAEANPSHPLHSQAVAMLFTLATDFDSRANNIVMASPFWNN